MTRPCDLQLCPFQFKEFDKCRRVRLTVFIPRSWLLWDGRIGGHRGSAAGFRHPGPIEHHVIPEVLGGFRFSAQPFVIELEVIKWGMGGQGLPSGAWGAGAWWALCGGPE